MDDFLIAWCSNPSSKPSPLRMSFSTKPKGMLAQPHGTCLDVNVKNPTLSWLSFMMGWISFFPFIYLYTATSVVGSPHSHEGDHAPQKLWSTPSRGLLVGEDIGNTETQLAWYDERTLLAHSRTFPTCLKQTWKGGNHHMRFDLCEFGEYETARKQGIQIYAPVRNLLHESKKEFKSGLQYASVDHETRLWFNLVLGLEDGLNTTLAFGMVPPIPRISLKAAGVQDLRRFWELHRPKNVYDIESMVPAQLYTIFLGLIHRQVEEQHLKNSRSTELFRVGSVLPIVPYSYFLGNMEPLIRAMYACLTTGAPSGENPKAVKGVDVLRFMYREFTNIHTLYLDQMGECLHSNLTVLLLDMGRTCVSIQYIQVQLGHFPKILHRRGVYPRLCGNPAETVSQWLHSADATQLQEVTDVIFSGGGWQTVPALRNSVELILQAMSKTIELPRGLPVRFHPSRAINPKDLPIRGAKAILHQQYGYCTCGQRQTFYLRCDIVYETRGTAPVIIPSFASATTPLKIDMMKPTYKYVYSLYDLFARKKRRTQYLSTLPVQGELEFHERGINTPFHQGQGSCALRVDPGDMKRSQIPKYRIYKKQVPQRWIVEGCLNVEILPILQSSGNVVLNYYVVDKRWYSTGSSN
jgi:hypothetical protein